MALKGCWTCKDRKVRCDRTQPVCQRCVKANKTCLGYGVRLNWPKAESSSRYLLRDSAGCAASMNTGETSFLNAGFWDMEIHQHLSASTGKTMYLIKCPNFRPAAALQKSIAWKPLELQSSEEELLAYFKSIAFKTLPTFDRDLSSLPGLLLRLALSDDTPSSKAVLKSLLAISSLHLHGLQSQAAGLKTSALKYLTSAVEMDFTATEGLKHVAAGLLLCTYEIQCLGNTTTQWCWFLCGANYIADSIALENPAPGSDESAILDWMAYHSAMTKFSLRHWTPMSFVRRPQSRHGSDGTSEIPHVCRKSRKNRAPVPSQEMLKLLVEVFETILEPSDPCYHREEYIEKLRNIESRIQAIRPPGSTKVETTKGRIVSDTNIELYKLASLIYLERASRNFSNQSAKLESYTEDAFKILSGQRTCDLTFPLFIFGCEAQSDERRKMILDLMNYGAEAHPQSLEGVRHMVQALWTQDDLEQVDRLDYLVKLDTIMNAHSIVPSFF